ncbi:MAG: hypothetical protein ACOZIN_19540 [Myxococcota bacterium]
MKWALLLGALFAAACIHDDRVRHERGGGTLFDSLPEQVKAPRQDRCMAHGTSSVRPHCDEAKGLAQTYARKLAPGDEVCLEGGFGQQPGAACLARAAVVDTGTNQVLLEIREARPESRWFTKVQYQVWFEEGALVDLYLADNGY